MQIKRMGILTISLVFLLTSAVLAGETARWEVDHSDRYSADPEWDKVRDNRVTKPELDHGVRGYFGPEQETPSKPPRPLGYPLDRHPQLDVWVLPAGHPPYGAGA